MPTADQYRDFATMQVRGYSPTYEVLASGVADDTELLGLLDTLPRAKRQPNLLFGVTRLLEGPLQPYRAFRTWVLDNWAEVSAQMLVRRTQTNEAGRCAALLPLLCSLPQPLALIEVGASAGLCLLPDRYRYRYDDGPVIGPADSPVLLPCRTSGAVPVPSEPPEVAARTGVDLNPLDITDPTDLRWLESLVWPEQTDRLERLRSAAAVARDDPAPIVSGDLTETIAGLVRDAPEESTPVVFHSAVLMYLPVAQRADFVRQMAELPCHWISNEGHNILPHISEQVGRPDLDQQAATFVLALDGKPKALAGAHGQFLDWLEPQ